VLGQARWLPLPAPRRGQEGWGWWGGAAWFTLAGLAIGALRPTNTWDLPPYLALGMAALVYAYGRYYQPWPMVRELLAGLPPVLVRALAAIGSAALLAGLAFLFFEPYAAWYALGYTQVGLWTGARTTLNAYLVHWSLFLFLIVSWIAWETLDWLDKTPASALRRLAAYRLLIWGGLIGLLAAIAATFWLGADIGWFILPLAAWAAILLLRPGQSDAKRFVLFLVGTGLTLTLMVELIVLKGDIGRMNTVFKFYLQVWTFFSISAATSLGWLWPALADWRPSWRAAWQVVLVVLVASASLFTTTATLAKIDDRMISTAPHTLDGMAYMRYASYPEEWGVMDLNQDYKALRWMQENVEGSPVTVEANLRNLYRWGSRFSIYTGLPGVVGWEWHQQQQRTAAPGSNITQRIAEIDEFYSTTDLQLAQDFLNTYNVRYIIVGQQERGKYPGPGLAKFTDANGLYWREVYRDGDTVIYEVIS
jgi:YYY domain-containing protein